MASNPSFLFSRGGIYYFRRKIPTALRKHFDADEVRKSLNTRDPQEALRLVRAEAQRMDELFAKLRAEQRAARGVRPLEISRESGETPAIEALFARWNAQATRPRTTVYDFAKATRRFAALHPNLPIDGVRTEHVEAFRDALTAEGLSVGTIRKQVGAIAAMLQVAVGDGLIDVNPARGVVIKAARVSRKPRVGFTPDELAAIFASPVYANGERPIAGAGAAAYWLPLLALYTGARQGEIGQLSVDDVNESEDVKFLNMLTEHTRPGETHRRPVPIHVDLIKLGFLQFVEMQRRAGEPLLFPELRTDNKGKRTGNWSKWFARYLRSTVGIRDRRKTFDSFRHTFAETCRKARVDDSVLELLVGRRTRRTAKQGAVPLDTLATAIGALHFVLDDKREEVDA